MRSIDRNATVMMARELRRRLTLPERLLWPRPAGLKFRRQHPIGWYVADFDCAAARLIVEVDGDCHMMGNNPAHDVRRDRWLREQGLKITRFAATEIMKDLDAVVVEIVRTATGRLPVHQALPGSPPHDIVGRN